MAMQAAAAQQAAVQQAQPAQQQKQKQQQPQNNNQTVQQISVSGRFMVGIGLVLGFGLGFYLKGQYFNSVLGLPHWKAKQRQVGGANIKFLSKNHQIHRIFQAHFHNQDGL